MPPYLLTCSTCGACSEPLTPQEQEATVRVCSEAMATGWPLHLTLLCAWCFAADAMEEHLEHASASFPHYRARLACKPSLANQKPGSGPMLLGLLCGIVVK